MIHFAMEEIANRTDQVNFIAAGLVAADQNALQEIDAFALHTREEYEAGELDWTDEQAEGALETISLYQESRERQDTPEVAAYVSQLESGNFPLTVPSIA